MYDTGAGVDRNVVEASRCGRLAAEQGHARAQVNLGSRVMSLVTEFNKVLLVVGRWYRLAAEQGYAEDKPKLALPWWRNGAGVDLSSEEAARLFRLAPEQRSCPGTTLSWPDV